LPGLRFLRVLTPAAEDLAAMKVFRFHAKDAEDVVALAGTRGFDRERFRSAFFAALPAAIGSPSWHEQSFWMIWGRLYPSSP